MTKTVNEFSTQIPMSFINFIFPPQILLLPCHSDKSKRRTKTLANTNEPRWGQTFIFSGLRRADLNNRSFEASLKLNFSIGKNQ